MCSKQKVFSVTNTGNELLATSRLTVRGPWLQSVSNDEHLLLNTLALRVWLKQAVGYKEQIYLLAPIDSNFLKVQLECTTYKEQIWLNFQQYLLQSKILNSVNFLNFLMKS